MPDPIVISNEGPKWEDLTVPEGADKPIVLEQPETVVEPTVVEPEPIVTPVVEPQGYKYNPVWDYLKEQGLEVPEKVIKGEFGENEKETDLIIKTILDNSEPDFGDDEIINEYYQKKNTEGFDVKEWLKNKAQEVDIETMPSRDYLFNEYKRLNKYEDNDINEYLDKMGKVELDEKATQLKNARLMERQMNEQKNAQMRQIEQQKYLQKQQEVFETNIKDILTKTKPMADYLGIPIDKVKRAEHDARFKEYFIPGSDGQRPIDKIVTPEDLYFITLLKDNGGALLKQYLGAVKEGIKSEIENKLGVKDSLETTGFGDQSPALPDWELLTRPEK